MSTWAKEIMILANDFCINTAKAREIINEVNTLTVPQGKREEDWRYDRAWSRIKPLIIG